MCVQKSEYDHEELLACARGELFGQGNPQLPAPPLLMIDRITSILKHGGAHKKGQVVAEMDVRDDLWFFRCHFPGDPVMPGALGLDALWQLTGFFLGWLGGRGRGRALGVGEVKFSGMVTPRVQRLRYLIDFKRIVNRKLVLGISDGTMFADAKPIFQAFNMRVGLFQDGR